MALDPRFRGQKTFSVILTKQYEYLTEELLKKKISNATVLLTDTSWTQGQQVAIVVRTGRFWVFSGRTRKQKH
jgi:hypothetical protein